MKPLKILDLSILLISVGYILVTFIQGNSIGVLPVINAVVAMAFLTFGGSDRLSKTLMRKLLPVE